MDKGPFSVVHKTDLAFSRDPHDYVSLGLYWWPDGKGYRRRDGVPNPKTQGPDFDRKRLKDFNFAVTKLTLAYELLGQREAGSRAAELVTVWFLDPATRMNPHLSYAQVVPGKDSNGQGIIDTFHFWSTLDAVDILIRDGLLTATDREGLRSWFKDYIRWLEKSLMGKSERKKDNNHGTSYDVQLTRYLIFVGRRWKAKRLLECAKKSRICAQIMDNGQQPHEQTRTKGLFYCWYNLTKILQLCELGARLGKDLLNHRGRVRSALAYVLPYLDSPELWPFEQIEPLEERAFIDPVFLGAVLFQDEQCERFMAEHPEKFMECAAYSTFPYQGLLAS